MFKWWKWVAFAWFCVYTTAEAAVMIDVEGRIGLGWTLVELVLSAVLGVLVVRVGGLHTLLRIHRRLQAQELPTRELLDMLLILLGGAMLILPGLISDACGLLLLLRPVRWVARAAMAALFGELAPDRPRPGSGGPMADEVIEVRARD